jgi:hypothetical protein
MSPQEKQELRRNLEFLLTNRDVQIFLDSIEEVEGAGANVLAGKGIGKSRDCQTRIANLDLSGHAVEQKLPVPCYMVNRNEGKISTAFGRFQITYTNWKKLKKQFNFKSFSVKNQGVAALELVRSRGKGFVALVQGNLKKAIRFGTQDWAGSNFSTLKGRKAPITTIAERRLRNDRQSPNS